MARILALGITVLDIVLSVDHMPRGDGKYSAKGRIETAGGVATNAARAIARLGGEAVLLSPVGSDFTGRRLAALLEEEGVDVGHLEWRAGPATALSTILVDAYGGRLLVNHSDPDLFDGPPRDLARRVGPIDAVVTDTRWIDGAAAALRLARELRIPAIVDFDRLPETGSGPLLEEASHVLFGRQGLAALTGKSAVDAALLYVASMSGAWIGATDGAAGTSWLEDGRVRHMPAFPVDAVDTLAAGDVFHGAFALAIAQAMAIEEALRFASAAAAIKCTRFGGASGTPGREEVERFLLEVG